MSTEESNIAVVAERMKGLANDMADVKLVLRELTGAVKQLAVLEVRQTEASKATERSFMEIDKLENRVVALAGRLTVLEQAQPLQKQTSDWVSRTVTAVVTAVVVAIVSLVVIKPDTSRAPATVPLVARP